MTIEPGRHLLHYRLVERIGEGGMGAVWKAIDTALGREVAIKILPDQFSAEPERLARFEREAKALAALSHPNIATIYGLHADGNRVFLAMELVAGEDLATRLARGALPVAEALDVARQIAEALDAAHEQGIVHRDLKPANVLRGPDGTVKLLDFGLAKIVGPEPGGRAGNPAASPTITSLGTQAGMILGTAAYMSPEQARGYAVDRRADLWALGVMLYEMLTGKRLFDGATVSDTLAAVLRADVDFGALPAGTPASVRRILRRCLERDPKRRVRDAGEVRFVAEELALGRAEEPEITGAPAVRATPWTTKLAWALLPVALLIGALTAITLRPPPAAPATQVVRATIPPPDGARFFLSSRQPGPAELSPDGRRITFVARNAERRVGLWVQELDLGTPVALAGTEGASYPFWSPDGRNIGFFADRKLKRIPADGGAVLSLSDAPFGKGGSWNAAGQILFSPTYDSPIHIVSEDGGVSTAVTAFDADTRENSHRFPFFLPDGRHFLYVARLADSPAADSRVRVGGIDGSDAVTLLDAPSHAVFRAGFLLYVKDTSLLARPFDPAARTLAGQPFVVATDIGIIKGAARGIYSASEDGKAIYMKVDRAQTAGMAWLDREGKQQASLADYGLLYEVAIAPDGNRVAARAESDLWVFDPRRGTRQRVTYGQKDAGDPRFTPDGKTLIYRARGERFVDLYAKAADGSGTAKLLMASGGDNIPQDVSPAGDVLAYAATEHGQGLDIWILPLADGAEPYPFIATPFDEEAPRFSPDGRFVAYQSNETGGEEIYIASFPDKNLRAQVSTDGGIAPRWSDDGTELFFLSPRDEVMAAPVKLSADAIDVGPAAALFFLTTPAYGNYDVSGDRFLVETEVEGGDRPPLNLVLGWPALREE